MKPVSPGRPRIEVQEIAKLLISHHPQDVRVTTDKEIRRIRSDFLRHSTVISARVAADVRHPNIDAFAFEAIVFGMNRTNLAVVDIPIDSTQRLEFGQLMGHFYRTKITGVPNLVAVLEVLIDRRIDVSVGVCQ